MIVRVREAGVWIRRNPDAWTRATLEAIHEDRQSQDFRDDPDAR